MRRLFSLLGLCLILAAPVLAQSDPPVKMSKSGICHAKGSTYYAQTKSFTPYPTLQACLNAVGRIPKR